MIAIWMLYVSAVGLCLGLAAIAVERAASLWAMPRRFVWVAAIVASLLVPVAGLMMPGVSVPRRVALGSASIGDLAAGPLAAPRPISAGDSHTGTRIGPLLGALNRPLLLLWGCASIVLALGLLRSGIGLRRRARGWRATVVDGTEVLVAPDIGPAVVRLGGLKVVLPEWALSAEPAARAMMLQHEDEHRVARDPDLLLGATVALMLVPWALPLWWHVRRLQLAVETDCDRRVMRAGADAHAYGVLLLSVGARSVSQPLLAPTAFSEARTLLERRIEAMASSSPKWRVARTVFATGVGALGVAVACVTPRPAPAPAQQPSPAPAQQGAPAEARQPAAVMPPQQATSAMPARQPAPAPRPQGERVYAEDSVTDRPVLLEHPPIRYPDSLKAAGIGGRVIIEAIIDSTGHVDAASVRVDSSSNPAFDAGAREVVLGSTFRPGAIDGRAVRVRVRIPLSYAVKSGERVPLPPGVYSEDSVTERPQLLSRPDPRYPDSLRTAGTFGAVVLLAIVDSTGHVDSASVRAVYSSNAGFEAPAREAVLASTYAPGRMNGRPVPVCVLVQLRWIPPAESLRHHQ